MVLILVTITIDIIAIISSVVIGSDMTETRSCRTPLAEGFFKRTQGSGTPGACPAWLAASR